MWFYFVFLFLIGLFLEVYNKNPSKYIHFIVVSIITLVAICRYNVGYDYETYFEIIQEQDVVVVDYLFAPLSALIAKIAIYFHSPQLLFVIFGTFTYVLILNTIRKYSFAYSLSVIVFVCLFYYTSLSIIRQALAVSITFYGYRYVVNRNFIKYIIVIALAILVHSSAIVAVIIYWLPKFKFSFLVILICLGLVVKPILFHLMEQYNIYSSYVTGEHEVEGGRFTSLLFFFILICCLFLWKKGKIETNDALVNIVTAGMSMYFIFGAHLGGRAALYFNVFICLLIPNVLHPTGKQVKYYMSMCFSFVMVFYFLSYLWMPFIKGLPSSYVPYKFFFFQ